MSQHHFIRIMLTKTLLFSTASLLVLGSAWADPAADKIVAKSDEARGPQGAFSMKVEVKDTLAHDTKVSVFKISSKGNKFSLVEQTEPARQQGRKLLMRDYDLWLSNPNISRPTRISFEQKLSGEVSNGDIVRTNFSEDYSATVKAEESIAGVSCFKINLVAKNKDVTYRSIDYWVDKKTFFPMKAVFFALSGKALKTATYSEFKSVLGRTRMTKVVIEDALQKNRTSVLTYSHHKKENFSDAYFSKESLTQ